MKNWKQRLYDNYVSTQEYGQYRDALQNPRVANCPAYRMVIDRFVPSNRDVSIADLGCGHGGLLHCLQELGYRNIYGVDISPEQISLAHQLGVAVVQCQSIESYLMTRSEALDVIFMIDVLEHLERQDLLETLELVYSKLSDKGTLILRVPNGEGLFGMRVRYGDLTHENCFTQRSIVQALRAVGFAGIRVQEAKPVAHGLTSLVRWALWNILTIRPRLLLAAETGSTNHILSQNLWAVAEKPEPNRRLQE